MKVSSILTSLNSEISTILGSSYKELDYIYDLEQNSNFIKTGSKRYGVGADSGSTVSGTTKAVTFDFNFFVVIAHSIKNRANDSKERESISDIYDQFDEINRSIFQKKLNNNNILLVSSIGYEAPTRIDDKTISIRADYTIKFRNQTT